MKPKLTRLSEINLRGMYAPQNNNNNVNMPQQPINNNIPGQTPGFKVGHCSTMRGWQSIVYNELQRNNDIYVIAKPGAGKTTPVICYWADKVLNFNPLNMNNINIQTLIQQFERLIFNPEDVGKMLILVPTRTLASTSFDDFMERYSAIILQALQFIIDHEGFNQRVENILREIFRFYNRGNDLLELITQRHNLYNNTYNQLNQNNHPDANIYAKQIDALDVEIFTGIALAIKTFISTKLISAVTGTGKEGCPPEQSPVVITIYPLGYVFFKQQKNNVKFIIIDEAHLIQSLPNDNDGDVESKCKAIYGIIKNIDSNNTRLAFMSGTINPESARNLGTYIKTCFNHNLKILDDLQTTGNPSNITVIPNDKLRNDDYLVDILTDTTSRANLIILFGKERIRKIINNALQKSGFATMNQVNNGEYEEHKFTKWSSRYKNVLHPSNPKQTLDFKNNINIMDKIITTVPGAEDISDPLLRKAVSAGFGYIFRQDDVDSSEGKKAIAQDIKIVTNLFYKGLIRTLIATDAVGIGVNLKVQTLYIPSIEKFNGIKLDKLDTGNASQLFNRVGRMAFSVSSIQTPSSYYPDVVQIISSGPKDFNKRVTFEHMPPSMCKTYDMFSKLWKSSVLGTIGVARMIKDYFS